MFTAVCVALSASGHVLASCDAVPLWSLGLGLLAVFGVALPLAGRCRSLPGIATSLAVGQLVLHAVFGYAQHAQQQKAAEAVSRAVVDVSLIERAARLLCGTGAAPLGSTETHRILSSAGLDPQQHAHAHSSVSTEQGLRLGPDLLPTLPMLLGHLLAALVAGWLLRHGDLALLRVAELSVHGAQGVAEGFAESVAEGTLVRALRAALSLVRALRAGLPGAPEVGPRAPRTDDSGSPRPRSLALQHTVIRRGPPGVSGPYALAA